MSIYNDEVDGTSMDRQQILTGDSSAPHDQVQLPTLGKQAAQDTDQKQVAGQQIRETILTSTLMKQDGWGWCSYRMI